MKYKIAVPQFKSRFRIVYRALKCLLTGELSLEIYVNQSPAPSDSAYTADEFDNKEINKWQRKFDARMKEEFRRLITDKEAL